MLNDNRIGIAIIRNNASDKSLYWNYALKELSNLVNSLIMVCLDNCNINRYQSISIPIEYVSLETDYTNVEVAEYILSSRKDLNQTLSEVLIFDDSFYGPLYDMTGIFQDMKNIEADYWGISKRAQSIEDYFLVLKESVFRISNFAKKFSQFKGVSIAITDLYSDEPESVNYRLLITDEKIPLIKKSIFEDSKEHLLKYNHADEISYILKYISDNYTYDINCIIQDLLNKKNITDIVKVLNSLIIIDDNKHDIVDNLNTVIVIHLFYMDRLGYYRKYIQEIPKDIDIVFTTNTEEKKELIQVAYKDITQSHNIQVRVVSSRGRDLAAFFVDCIDLMDQYEYIGFIHDKKSIRDGQSPSVGDTFSNILWDNILYSSDYISNIIEYLKGNSKLGLMIPPTPYHGPYNAVSDNFWTRCLDKTKELLARLNINIDLDINIEPLSIGSAFWARTAIFRTVVENPFTHLDFPEEPMDVDGTIAHALERVFPYLAQHEGYTTSYVMNPYYAAAEIFNFRELYYHSRRNERNVSDLNNELEVIVQEKLNENEHMLIELKKIKYDYSSILQSYNEVTNSIYWKLTAPIRFILNKLKGK